MSTTQTEKRIGITGTGPGHVRIENLSELEREVVEGSIDTGNYWIRRNPHSGRLLFRNAYEELPDPVTDEKLLPFWRRPTEGERANGELLISIDEGVPDFSSPAITIQSLCGYGYTPERYAKAAAVLTSFGFQCLRSRRGREGRYWEMWYLPGLWATKGDLEELVRDIKVSQENKTQEEIIRMIGDFIFRRAPFGTLDATSQRLCMASPD